MSRSAALASLTAIALAAAFLTVGFAAGSAAASPQQGPFCGVCGEWFDENVTATEATLQMTADGDVRWRVENKVETQRAEAWGENPEAAERRARERLHDAHVSPSNPTDLSVRVRDETVVVEFVDRGAARERLGLLVLPYFHGEGSAHRWTVNADELVVEAPDGQRIVNDPAGATVEGDRAVWTGTIYSGRSGPEPGDGYVVAGEGVTAGAQWALVSTVVPLDSTLYGMYGVGWLFVAGLAFGVYTIKGHRLGPRRVSAGVAAATVPYLLVVAVVHPPGFGPFTFLLILSFGIPLILLLGLVGGVALHVAAASVEQPSVEGRR